MKISTPLESEKDGNSSDEHSDAEAFKKQQMKWPGAWLNQVRSSNWAPPEESPELSASPLGKLIFSWVDPLFKEGYRRPLTQIDLLPLAPRYQAAGLANDFEQRWKASEVAYKEYMQLPEPRPQVPKPPLKPSVSRILIAMFARGFLPVGILKLIADTANATAPFVMQALVNYVSSGSTSNPSPTWLGIIYAILLFILSMTSSLSISYFFQRAGAYGISARAALTAAAYRKSLRLSGASRQKFSSGRVTNMISTDLSRLEIFFQFFHLMWTFPIQVITIVGLLISVVGVSALAGVALLIALTPLQTLVIRIFVKLRKANAVTADSRVKLTSETISAIRVVKFFAWEDSFLERILQIRGTELKAVMTSNVLRSLVTASGFAIPVLAAAITFMMYATIAPGSFTAVNVYTAMALFNMLRNPIMWAPIMMASYADATVAVGRLQELFEAEELEFQPTFDSNSDKAVKVKNGDFYWEVAPPSQEVEEPKKSRARTQSSMPPSIHTTNTGETKASLRQTLFDINFSIPKGSLVAIVGSVGSGKSSLLSAIVGQLKQGVPGEPLPTAPEKRPSVVLSGSVGYVPQQAWIMNSSLKDNILFGINYDERRYRKAIEACSLLRDLEVLPGGDMAEIGERGINLSGGQKQRVSIARAVYFNADIVLLDDPLSAVDAHVGRELFENCICGTLKKKTRLLVTHQLHFVPQCDIVITMKDGHVAEHGTYSELMAANGEFAALMRSYGGIKEPDEDEKKEIAAISADSILSAKSASKDIAKKPAEPAKGLIVVEDRMTGGLSGTVVVAFALAMGGGLFLAVLVMVLCLTQATRIATDLWLVDWTSRSFPDMPQATYLWVYFALSVAQTLTLYIFSVLVALGGVWAARGLHQLALRRVMYAPTQFFDTNPLGRILNRFSRDQDIVDNTLSDAIRLFSLTFATAIATFGLVAYATKGWFVLALVPMMAFYYRIQDMYRCVARELKRLDAISRSPLYAHVSESMTGVATIAAYREQDRFMAKTDQLIDANNVPYYLALTGQRWLGLRLESIGNILVLVTSIFAAVGRNSVSPSLIGLALSYVLQVTQLLSLCIRQYTEAEVQLVSIERLNYYATNVDTEAPPIVEGHRPPPNWPTDGQVEFSNVSMRYQEGLPLVLNDVSMTIKPGEKIGVVGRTGSGKSSLMLSLFRVIENEAGTIKIDGVNTSEIGLRDLRSRLSIIPQDPILFSGSVRTNLDPFSEHADADLWFALEASGMKSAVAAMDSGLDAQVDANGENLSVGQRQLLCLARALLRKPKLIVLDECTANVDLETDNQIQQTVRTHLANSTILTIAHRLNTIIDYDRILLLSGGQVAEFDTPAALLSTRDTIFSSMVDGTGEANAAALRKLAKASAAA